MILVVDPNPDSRAALLKTLTWADGRYHVHAVESGAAAWALISARRRVNLVVCSTQLSDIAPLELAARIRQHSPGAVLVFYTEDAGRFADVPDGMVDGYLTHPICRYTVLEYLKRIKEKHRELNAAGGKRRRSRRMAAANGNGNDTSGRIGVLVQLDGDENPLSFKVEVNDGSEVRTLLNQLGKKHVVWYRLHRNKNEIEAHESTALQNGDVLVVRAT